MNLAWLPLLLVKGFSHGNQKIIDALLNPLGQPIAQLLRIDHKLTRIEFIAMIKQTQGKLCVVNLIVGTFLDWAEFCHQYRGVALCGLGVIDQHVVI